MMNVRNEPLHDMACVVKREPPTGWRWRLCEFQHRQILFFLGTNNMLWIGLQSHCTRIPVFFMFGHILVKFYNVIPKDMKSHSQANKLSSYFLCADPTGKRVHNFECDNLGS